jgi:CheY-like chemotaxis protein
LRVSVKMISAENGRSKSIMQSLPLRNRQSLLLVSVEGFSIKEASQILDISKEQVISDISQAREAIQNLLISNVMIIEDEPLIALHLEAIVKEIGHTVCGVARTRTEAVEVAQQTTPDIVLADISLADGSSGIDAVKDILSAIDVPVIFITAFPERLLTGERPEPTYLITKPFEPETVTATIGQALLFYNEQQTLMREMA